MWLASADVTGQRGQNRVGLVPSCLITPAGYVVAHLPAGTVGMAFAQTNQP